MNEEEIEELKEFTIDLTDIDELALGLEVCSKKSNMVIQEFIDTIEQLQQENQELKEQVDYLRKSIERKEETIIELEHERVPYTNEYVEELKEELEEKNKPQIFIDTQDIEERYAEGLYQDYLEEENKKYKNQQKEFIEWLENEKNINSYDISDYTYEDIINTILSKYEEIIEK